jgi:hypothetical protein
MLAAHLTLSPRADAEVLRLPPVALNPPFAAEAAFLPGAETWGDYRWYATEEQAPDFGTDFELGSRAALYAAPYFALTGTARLLYQSRHLENYDNPFAFSPRHLATDLRLLAHARIDPVLIYGGFRHDCTHTIDDENRRTPIHDALLIGASVRRGGIQWPDPQLSAAGRAHLEGEVNVPATFTDPRDMVDRGRVSAGLRLEPLIHARYGTLFLDGTASLIFRDPDTSVVGGAEATNFDWTAAIGYRTPGEDGTLSVYLRVERLTDPWVAREVEPVTVTGIGALLHMR